MSDCSSWLWKHHQQFWRFWTLILSSNDPIVCIYVSFCTLSLLLFSVLSICSVLIFNEVYVTTCILVFWWYEPTNRNTFWQANTHYQVLQKTWLWENPFVLAYLGLGQHERINYHKFSYFQFRYFITNNLFKPSKWNSINEL